MIVDSFQHHVFDFFVKILINGLEGREKRQNSVFINKLIKYNYFRYRLYQATELSFVSTSKILSQHTIQIIQFTYMYVENYDDFM